MRTISNQYWNFRFFHEFFFQKHKKCSYSNNFGRMWLVNELVPTFSAVYRKLAKSVSFCMRKGGFLADPLPK